jgi:hypothetical protein
VDANTHILVQLLASTLKVDANNMSFASTLVDTNTLVEKLKNKNQIKLNDQLMIYY